MTTINEFLTGFVPYFSIVIDNGPFAPGAVEACISQIRDNDLFYISVVSHADPVIVGEIISSPKSIEILRINSDTYNKLASIPNNIKKLIISEGEDEFTADFPMSMIEFSCFSNNMSVARAYQMNNRTKFNMISCDTCSDEFTRMIAETRRIIKPLNVLKLDRFIVDMSIEADVIDYSSIHNIPPSLIEQMTNNKKQLYDINVRDNKEMFWQLRKFANIRSLMVSNRDILDNYDGKNNKIKDYYISNDLIKPLFGDSRYFDTINLTMTVRPYLPKLYLLLHHNKLPKDLIRVIRDTLYA